jgi:ABC-type lipoprotein release transport system permease subunit
VFPTTVLLALVATLVPAWRAANASPALLRRS